MIAGFSSCRSRPVMRLLVVLTAATVTAAVTVATADYCCMIYGDDGQSVLQSCTAPDFNCCYCSLKNGPICRRCGEGEECRGVYNQYGQQTGVTCVRRAS